MKPRKGFTPVMGNKNWGRARKFKCELKRNDDEHFATIRKLFID